MSAHPAVAAEAPRTSRFETHTPRRLLDTRGTVRVAKGAEVTVSLGEIDSNGLTAAVVNLTAVKVTEPGFLTAFADGKPRPEASNLNASQAGETVASLATVPVGPDGRFRIYASSETDLLVDLFGIYRAADQATSGRFIPRSPTRVYDTRDSTPFGPDEQRTISLLDLVPQAAGAVVVNMTATGTLGSGYFTAWDATAQTRPDTSNLNVEGSGDTVANQAIVPLTDGRLSIYSQTGGDVLVDVVGYFTGTEAEPGAEGLYVPVTPTRLLDTRTAELNPIEHHFKPRAGNILHVPMSGRAGVGLSASAVAVSVTGVTAESPGFLAAWPSGTTRPNASTLNATMRGQTVANHALLQVSRWGISVTSSTPWHVIVDINGWYTGKPVAVTETYKPPIVEPMVGHLDLQSLGLSWRLGDGISDEVLDNGPMHWTYSALPGELGTAIILGHRTTHGGPFRRLGELQPGDRMTISHAGRTFTYRVTDTVTVPPDDVLSRARHDTANLILVACHPIGGTSHRIVVHAELVDG